MHALRFSYTMHALKAFSWLCMHIDFFGCTSIFLGIACSSVSLRALIFLACISTFFIACAFNHRLIQLPGEHFFREGWETVFSQLWMGVPIFTPGYVASSVDCGRRTRPAAPGKKGGVKYHQCQVNHLIHPCLFVVRSNFSKFSQIYYPNSMFQALWVF